MGLAHLVLLPGRLCDARLFRHQLENLADIATIQVADLTVSDSIEGLAQAVLQTAPPRFSLAGLSLGGIVALEIMRQAPERVIRLALLDTNPGGNGSEQLAEFEAQLELVRAGQFERITPQIFYPKMVHPDRLDDLRLKTEVCAMAETLGVKAFVRQVTALIHRRDSWDVLGEINCPTLILCGQQDKVCPPALHERMANLTPYSRLTLVEKCGHLATMEQPDKVTQTLRAWLLQEFNTFTTS